MYYHFHLFSIASFAPISFAIKAKENDLLPLEKNRVKLDDDSDDDEESKEGQESSSSATNTNPAVAPPCVVVEEKRPQLTQEELEAKQGLSICFKLLKRKVHKYKINLLSQNYETASWSLQPSEIRTTAEPRAALAQPRSSLWSEERCCSLSSDAVPSAMCFQRVS